MSAPCRYQFPWHGNFLNIRIVEWNVFLPPSSIKQELLQFIILDKVFEQPLENFGNQTVKFVQRIAFKREAERFASGDPYPGLCLKGHPLKVCGDIDCEHRHLISKYVTLRHMRRRQFNVL